MSRALIVAVVVVVVLTVFATVDCAMSDAKRARVLQKPVWLVVILLLPVVGPLLWMFFGKVPRSKMNAAPALPDDDPALHERLRADREHDARIRELEEEMRKLDEEIEEARQNTMRNHPSNHTGAQPVIDPDDESTPEPNGAETDGVDDGEARGK